MNISRNYSWLLAPPWGSELKNLSLITADHQLFVTSKHSNLYSLRCASVLALKFKQKLSDLVVEKISPISDEINKLKKDNNFIDKILEEGAVKADKITSKKVKEMKEIIGF